MQYETLTDLLNNEAGAYNYFYSLSPEMQTSLWQRGGPPPMSRSSAAPARFDRKKKQRELTPAASLL